MFELKFLGTADSGGIPSHNCGCSICQEYRKMGKKSLATSAYIECENKEIILLDAGVEDITTIFDGKKIVGIFLTHFHPDHVLGLLRLRHSSDDINCYHPEDKEGFADLFKHPKSIKFKENTPLKSIKINNMKLTPIPLMHSKNTTGYLIESSKKTVAYLTDCAGISKQSMDYLVSKTIDECYIDACLTPNFSNKNHLNYEEATTLLDMIGAQKSYLIHASHFTLEYIKSNNISLKYNYC